MACNQDSDMNTQRRIKCPSCGKSLTVSSSAIGRKGKCPACDAVFNVGAAGHSMPANAPPPPPPTSRTSEVQLAQQPTHGQEFERDKGRILTAVSAAPDKYAIVEPYLMEYETPVALAVQRQFPFSVFADIVLLTSHRVLMFKRFFTKIDMFDVNYVDFKDVTIKQGFFTSALTVRTDDRRSRTDTIPFLL
jgi:hypothetical protein